MALKCTITLGHVTQTATYKVNVVGNVMVSPLRPQCVLAKGVATVFSAPA